MIDTGQELLLILTLKARSVSTRSTYKHVNGVWYVYGIGPHVNNGI